MSKVLFYRDTEANVPTGAAHAGKVYFTNERNLYIIDAAGNKQKFTDVIFEANEAAITALATKYRYKIYVAIAEATMWFWDGTTWYQLGGSAGGYTDEQAQDAIGAILSAEFDYDDVGNIISIAGINASKISGSKTSSFISDFAATVRSTVLTGLSTATNAAITAADSVLVALGKLQAQITYAIGLASAALPATDVIDEDDMASDSDTKVPTQQSVKAYVDAAVIGGGGYTDEQAQDAVGGILSAEFTYDDAGNAISINSIAATKISGTKTSSFISDFAATVRSTVLTGLSTATNAAIAAADSVLVALGKLQAQIDGLPAATQTLTNKTLTSPVINSPTGIVKSDVGLGNVDNTSDATKNSATATLINKRITMRVQSVASSATVTPDADADDCVIITAQAAALTLANPSGTPTPMQPITIRIKDNGTARTIGYGSQYRAIGITLPTTTVINKTIYLGMMYNSADTKWDVIGYALEA